MRTIYWILAILAMVLLILNVIISMCYEYKRNKELREINKKHEKSLMEQLKSIGSEDK